MRVAIQGDIGQPVYHVGDEAMAHAAVAELAARGVRDVVLLTRDIAHTHAHFGTHLEAARTLTFPWEPVDRERYLGEIKAVMAGDKDALPPHDQVFAVIETLRTVDALLIAGGGNMNSRYGWLLYERAAMAHIAIALGKQVVIGGQTIGPRLSDTDRGTLANLLRNASLVGLREDHSLALARELAPGHTGLRTCLDDAVILPDPTAPEANVEGIPAGPWIAATIASPEPGIDRNAAALAYARLLDAAATHLDCPIVLLAHMSTPGAHDGDEAFHSDIARHLSAPATQPPIMDALTTAALTRRAGAVVTSRYHPVVFAGAAGIPAVAIAPDEYSHVRLTGALDRFGLDAPVPSLADLMDAPTLDPAWLAPLDADPGAPTDLDAAQAAWWDTVVAALGSTQGRTAKLARHWMRSRRHDLRRLQERVTRR
ncbi:MAG: polysaccharide pyruvyl transferase family protein [Propionibacteriaceae bacterium]|nr:polysaccharide pyruvyl transferase family protein [Propionibacteriaceae bacterium]